MLAHLAPQMSEVLVDALPQALLQERLFQLQRPFSSFFYLLIQNALVAVFELHTTVRLKSK